MFFERIANSPSRTALAWAVAFIAGVTAHAAVERPWPTAISWWPAVGLLIFGLVLSWRRPRRRLAIGLALFFLLALARYESALSAMPEPGPMPERTATLRGVVREEPERGLNGTVLTLDRVAFADGSTGDVTPVGGAVSLRFTLPIEVRYGDTVQWSGRLFSATPDQPFQYGILWSGFSYEAPQIISRGAPSWFGRLFDLKALLRRLVAKLLPEPEASFLLGLLIGERQGLPPDLTQDFRSSGTSHILAVSGYNVTKVVEIALVILAIGRIRRRRAAGLTLAVVFGFVALTGAEASVVRAALMGSLALFASLLGRRYSGATALSAAAAAMLIANPFLLRHDIGFRLSFAAVCGLHFLGPPLAKRLASLPDFLDIRKNAADTLAATLATLPFTLQTFGRLPLIGPVANLLILPLVPWAMLFGALSVAVGLIWPTLGLPFAWLAYWLLRLIEGLAHLSATVAPWAVEGQVGPLACAALVGFLILLWYALDKAKPISLRRRRPLPAEIEIHET